MNYLNCERFDYSWTWTSHCNE